MVVIAASIITESGKVLVSRQFADMSRTRIEGLLAAFSNLVGACKQHIFVETDEVRFVYQRLDGLYLLLVTNKQSNIFEDLDTLMLLSKLVPEYSRFLNEESICKSAFKQIFAFDESISLGNKETVTLAQVKQYCEMESQEEKLHKMLMQSKINEAKDVMSKKAREIEKSKIKKGRLNKGGLTYISGLRKSESTSSGTNTSSSRSSHIADTDNSSKSEVPINHQTALAKAPPKGMGMQLGKGNKANQFLESLQAEGEVILEDVHASSVPRSKSAVVAAIDPIILTIEERLNVAIKKDGGLNFFDVQGTLFLQVFNQEDGIVRLQIESKDIPGLSFRMHPNINKDLFYREHIIGLKDPNSSFPTGQNEAVLVKWRIQNLDESSLPLMVYCWPYVSADGTLVNIEYEASYMFDLQNVVISIPLPPIHETPNVTQIDGEWSYNSRNSVLEWSVPLIDDSNRSGSMEIILPPDLSPASLLPINISFTAAKTYSEVKVTCLNQLRGEVAPKYTQRIKLITDSYQVV